MPETLAPTTGNTKKAELAAFALLIMFTGLLVARQYVNPIPTPILLILFSGAISGLWAWFLKRRRKTFTVQAGALIFCMFLGGAYSLMLFGGLASPVTFFIMAIPVGAAVFVNRRFGFAMLLCCTVLYGLLTYLHRLGYPFGPLPFDAFGNNLTTAVYAVINATALLLVVSFDQTRRTGETLDAQTLAETDFLTGVLNRAGFEQHFRRARRDDRRHAALLAIDIDHFKACNDTRGHDAGDRCLREIAAAIAGCVSRKNDFVGRVGGDEFLVLLSNADMTGALQVAEKMREAVSDLHIFTAEEPPRKITVTIGIASITRTDNGSDTELDQFYKAVDRALYSGKHDGRDCIKVVDSNVYAVNFAR